MGDIKRDEDVCLHFREGVKRSTVGP